jgi:CheY-like chemotaxis protein
MSKLNRRVLVVDDNEGLTRLLARLLARLGGHQVQQAVDGPSALQAFEEFHPEIVLLDIGLPGFDGYEVISRMREMEGGQGVVIAALTGYGEEKDRQNALAAGFDAFMVKPASIAELEALFQHPKLSG